MASPIDLPFVPYEEPPKFRSGLLILGEAPGREEVSAGRPFAGKSGRLLRRTLIELGIDPGGAVIGNVFRYRPPENDPKVFFGLKRDASSAGLQRGRQDPLGYVLPAYDEELEHLQKACDQAQLILAFGRVPLWATTGRSRVRVNAGKDLASNICGATVIATWHPSHIGGRGRSDEPEWRRHLEVASSHLASLPRSH